MPFAFLISCFCFLLDRYVDVTIHIISPASARSRRTHSHPPSSTVQHPPFTARTAHRQPHRSSSRREALRKDSRWMLFALLLCSPTQTFHTIAIATTKPKVHKAKDKDTDHNHSYSYLPPNSQPCSSKIHLALSSSPPLPPAPTMT